MSIKTKLEIFAGIAPAVAIIVFVSAALSGYTAPSYSLDEVEQSQSTPTGQVKEITLELPEEEPAEELEIVEEAGAYKDGVYYGSGMGYNDLVNVKVTISDAEISEIVIVSHKDDQPYFNDAKASILPAIIQTQTTNVDTVTGATYSSNGIIKAVRNALAKAAVSEDAIEEYSKDEEEESNSADNASPSTDIEGGVEELVDYIYKDGEYTNDKNMILCENPKDTSWAYYLSVKITIKDGKIVEVKESKKTGKTGTYNVSNDSYLNRAFNGLGSRKGIAAKILELQGTAGVDAVTSATYSSLSIIESVNWILPTIDKIPVVVEEPEEPTEPEESTEPETPVDDNTNSDVSKEPGKVDDVILETEGDE